MLFCLGAFFGSLISNKFGSKLPLLISGILVGIGFSTTGMLEHNAGYMLYITYGILAGCGIGISYGSCPTITAAFTSSFYGQKHYATNYSITNFNLIFASFVANISNSLLISTGSYTAPFIMLLLLSLAALVLNFSIRRP